MQKDLDELVENIEDKAQVAMKKGFQIGLVIGLVIGWNIGMLVMIVIN